jgi:hypothetical protein
VHIFFGFAMFDRITLAAIHATVTWANVARLPHGPNGRSLDYIYMSDPNRSALLSRILNNKAPLPFAPPTKNGMPWYELFDDKQSPQVINELEFSESSPSLNIDGATWKVISFIVGSGSEIDVQSNLFSPELMKTAMSLKVVFAPWPIVFEISKSNDHWSITIGFNQNQICKTEDEVRKILRIRGNGLIKENNIEGLYALTSKTIMRETQSFDPEHFKLE